MKTACPVWADLGVYKIVLTLMCGIAVQAHATLTPKVCGNATTATKAYVHSVRKIAEQRFEKREITLGQYKTVVNKTKGVEQRITFEKCMVSRDAEREVYQCLADRNGNYPLCQK